jgi:L-serine dehydratase
VRLTLTGISQKKVQIIAVSLGGGSFEIRSVDGFPVRLSGDLYGLMIFTKNKPDNSADIKAIIPSGVEFSSEQKEDVMKYEFKSSHPFSAELMTQLKNHPVIDEIALLIQ